jgi:DNA (cytosine-5)-methyltransferase 1
MIRAGSLCSGYEGIFLGIQEVLGEAELVFTADNDPGASKVLAHRFPDVPDLGDISAVDWAEVMRGKAPLDLLTAGFPCQDVSGAGLRKGLFHGTRTGLWYEVARAIHELAPRFVLLENVPGLRSAPGHSELERCEGCMGDAGREPFLRAFQVVLGDLASLGFDAEWRSVRASGAGAPHRRERVFIFGWAAADPDGGPEHPGPVERGSGLVAAVEGHQEPGGGHPREHPLAAVPGQPGLEGHPRGQRADGVPPEGDLALANPARTRI